MSLLKPRPDKNGGRDLRQMALLTVVPGLILAAPLVGYGIGWWLDSKFETDPYLQVIGVLLGLGSAGIETYNIIKRASSSNGEADDGSDSGI